MKFGMNLLLWTDSPWDEATMPVVESLARMGFDGVELPIFSGGPSEYAALGRRLDDVGLERTAITVRNVEDDPISADPAIRRAAIDATRHAIDCAAASGALMRRAESSPSTRSPMEARRCTGSTRSTHRGSTARTAPRRSAPPWR